MYEKQTKTSKKSSKYGPQNKKTSSKSYQIKSQIPKIWPKIQDLFPYNTVLLESISFRKRDSIKILTI